MSTVKTRSHEGTNYWSGIFRILAKHEGQFFVRRKESMRGQIIGRDIFRILAKHEWLFFMPWRFKPTQYFAETVL